MCKGGNYNPNFDCMAKILTFDKIDILKEVFPKKEKPWFGPKDKTKNEKKDSISDKWADYSKRTISSLLEQGKRDAFKMLVGNLIKLVDSLQEPNTSMYPSDEIINKRQKANKSKSKRGKK